MNEIIKKLEKIYKLKDVIRYNTKQKLKDESVAEHSFYVALISLLLCFKFNIDAEDTLQILIKSLLHDMPEIELNDITHDVKEKLNLRPLLKSYEDDYYLKEFPECYELMINNEENEINEIVNLADSMSVLQYTNNELSIGNKTNDMLEIYKNSYIRVFENLTKLEEKYEKDK